MKPSEKDIAREKALDQIKAGAAVLAPSLAVVRVTILQVLRALLGVVEIGSTNTGYWVDKFQKSIGMYAKAWCLALLQYVYKFVSDIWGKSDLIPFNTASTQRFWEWAQSRGCTTTNFNEIQPCDLLVWKDGAHDQGHVGAVVETDYDTQALMTVEGNTSSKDWRNGGSVQEKQYTSEELNLGVSSKTERWCRGAVRLDKLFELANWDGANV